MKSNREEKIVFNQPKTFEERKEAAKILVERLHFKLPLAIDSMDNRAETVFSAWPERIYILAAGGKVIYKGGMGPFGFHPEEAEKALVAHAPKPASAPAS
jgi:iodothyronine deiodinase-like protein